MKPTLLLTCLAVASAGLSAQSISINFAISTNDNNSVNPGESAAQFYPVDGAHWNHVQTRSSGAGTLGFAIDGTALIDDSGANAATLNASFGVGAGYSNFNDTSDTPARGQTGEGGLMQSYLNFGGAVGGETLTVNGLGPEFTTNGYELYLYFDLNVNRTYGHTVDDGSTSSTFWTQDQAAVDADANEDGLMEWVQATGTTSGTATLNANYAIHTGLSGSSFTITGLTTGGRSALSGLQIVAIPDPAQPFLNTPSVSNITTTTADAAVTLGNSDATDVTLYWDTIDQGTGAWTSSSSLGAQVVGPVNGNITGLSADTLYFYRFLATNTTPDPDLEAWSDEGTSFVTAFTGKAVTDLGGSLFEANSVDLAWTDNFDNETGFSIQRSETMGGPYTEIATLGPESSSYIDEDPTLAQGVTYHYVVVATGPSSDSDVSNEVSVMNGPVPAPAPTTAVISINHTVDIGNADRSPTPMATTDIAGLVPDEHWNNVTVLSGQNPSPHANNVSIPAGSLLDSDGSVVPGASYSLTSADSWGETLPDFDNIFSPGHNKMLSDLAIFKETDGFSLVIDGLTSTYTDGGYRVIIYTLQQGQDRTAQWSLTPEGQSEMTYDSSSEAVDPQWTTVTTGEFRLSTDTFNPGNYIFFDVPAGIDGFTIGVNASTAGRAPINGMQIVAAGNPILVEAGVSSVTTTDAQASAELQHAASDVTLFWDSAEQGVRGTWTNSLALGAQVVGPVTGAISGLAVDTRVFYRFFANNGGLEAWSAEESSFATALTGKAVTDLAGILFGPDEIDLSWTDNFNTETGFSIRRSETPGGPYTEIATVPADSEFFTDITPLPGVTYHYVIVAVNEAGDADNSNEVSVTNGATFGSWIATFGLDLADQGPNADPDGDKLDNLTEAFLGTDPSVANTGITNVTTDGTVTTFSHPQADPALTDITGSYEWSLDAQTWYAGDGADGPGGGPTVTIPAVVPTGGTAAVTATASTALDRLFIRITVTN